MSVATLPPEALDLVRALGRGRALVPLDKVAGRWGMDAETGSRTLAALVEAGFVDVWEPAPGKPSAVLSAESAAALGLELATGAYNRHYWVETGDGVDASVKPTGNGVPLDTEAGEYLDTLPDPNAIDPAEAAAEADEYTTPKRKVNRARFHGIRGRAPTPRLLLGLGVVGWKPEREPGEPCPGCGGRKLRVLEYCLVDDRSGAEFMIPTLSDAEKPRAYNPQRAGLKGGRSGNRPRNKNTKRGRR